MKQMPNIIELIERLCENGVEYKKIEELCSITRGKVMSKDFIRANQGDYPVYSSQTENNGEFGKISTYDFEGEYLTWTTDGANAGSVFYRNGKFSVTNVCGLLKVIDNKVLTKYLFYILSVEAPKYVNAGMGNPKLMSNVMSKIKVAVPPLEVQCEIVRILDDFTLLSAELSAELKARQKQYEYYKDKLLKNYDNTEKILLKDVAEYSKDRISAEELDDEHYVGVDNLLQNKMGKTISNHIPKTGNSTKYHKGDILIGNIRPYLKKIWFADNEGGTNGDVLAIHVKNDKVIPEYLYYILSSDCFFDYDNSNSKGAKMPRGNKETVMNYDFYLPDLDEQNRIVNILKKFEIITHDISEGLPAEIEARQKQYEYYRDKLLTFKELVNEG